MGNPKKIVKAAQQQVEDSYNDAKEGVRTGDPVRALTGTYGALNPVGSITQRAMGIKTQTEEERIAKDEAGAAEQDDANLTALTKQAKLDKIRNRLDQEIKLRQRAPGRSQTLLTSLLEPNKTNPQTSLITTANRK